VKLVMGYVLVVVFLSWGGLVYYAYIATPYKAEFGAVRSYIFEHYNSNIRQVVFIQADEDGFAKNFGVNHYKDEFGMPSTFKGWVAEPLVKELVYEMTGNRQAAEGLMVTCYKNAKDIPDPSVLGHADLLFVDLHSLF